MANFVIENNLLKKFSGVEKSVTVSDGITVIGDSAFMFKIRMENVVLPEGLLRIEEYAFYRCKDLLSITLPASLVFIGKSAFKGCSSLKEIKYGGTKAQWKSIKKRRNVF